MRRFVGGALAILAAAVTAAPALHAQAATGGEADSLRQRWLLEAPAATLVRAPDAPWASPSMGANSPTGFGAEFGDFYAGGTMAARARYVDAVDGAVAAGFGLGDADRYAALDVTLISFSTFRSGFTNRMAADLKLHRTLPAGFGVALGMEAAWIRGFTDAPPSRYLVVSKWTPLRGSDREPFSAFMVSVGVGDGRFRRESDWVSGRDRLNLFGSAAVRVLAPLSLIADWTGQDLTLGASVAPFRDVQLVITPAVADLTGSAGDGARLMLSVGAGVDLF